MAYLEFPEEEWMHLRTTNLIERLNKEFKRRTKPMEIVAGEASVYTLLAFVAVKMEASWRNAPFSKLRPSEAQALRRPFSHTKVDTTGMSVRTKRREPHSLR